jgi:heme/copper-type cytochrome/quinol oxidase subunit 2
MRWRSFALKVLAAGAFFLLTPAIALADDSFTIELTLKDHKFEPAEIKAPAGKPIVIKLRNLDSAPEEFESAALHVEKIVAPMGQITIRLKPLKTGRYPFIGEYNDATAKGVLIVE